jgi:hypothetical protein
MDRAVAIICNELMQISLAFSAYYPLCLGGPPCAYAEAVERLIRRAASARGAEELVEALGGRVKLEELGLPDPALEALAEELGPEPPWLDALATSFFRLYLSLGRRRRVDGRDLALALCLWAQKKRREDPRNPLWRAVKEHKYKSRTRHNRPPVPFTNQHQLRFVLSLYVIVKKSLPSFS